MIIPKVRMEIWKELYDAAISFKEAAPWELFGDDEVFAVKDPVTGDIGYCSILGWLGEMFALCVYRGDEGLATYQKLQNQEIDPERDDFFAINNASDGGVYRPGAIEKEDLRIIKDLGYKFRGAKAYPAFRSYLPGCAPWFLTEGEAVFLDLPCAVPLTIIIYTTKNAVALERKGRNQFCFIPPRVNGGEATSFEMHWFSPEPLLLPRPPIFRLMRSGCRK